MIDSAAEPGPGLPCVSVIILAYNHQAYVRACLESIRCLDYPNLELILLEDGSTDATLEIARSAAADYPFPSRILTQANTGDISGNSQKLLQMATGKYTLLLAGDDLLVPGFPLRDMVRRMEAAADLVLCLPRAVHVVEGASDQIINIYTPGFRDILLSGNPDRVIREHLNRSVSRLFLQGALIRRTFYESFGGFDTERLADDYGFMMRAFHQMRTLESRFAFVEDALWIYRVHGRNVHADDHRQRRLVFEIVSTYVPPDCWAGFVWDHQEPDDFDGFVELCDQMTSYFGDVATSRLEPRMLARFLHKAMMRRDFSSLARAFERPRFRWRSIRYVAPRAFRLLPGYRRSA